MIPLGPFDLTEPIGKGAMGVVWGGEHRQEKLPVAVKFLTGERAREARFRASFRNESRLVAGLDHPHIVRVFEYGEVSPNTAAASEGKLVEGMPWLAMEQVSGGTLRRLRGRISWPQLKQVLHGLLDALAHAHARGVIHRDIKPGNVLVGVSQKHGERRKLNVKLTDFGVARALDGRADDEAMLSMFSGTPAYMAPEQFIGRWRDYGPWTDLYALGCLSWTLLTGHQLFGQRSLEERAIAHLRDPLPTLDTATPLPAGFEEWLHRLLEKHPRRRFQRAADAGWSLAKLGDAQLGEGDAWHPNAQEGDPSLGGSAFHSAIAFGTESGGVIPVAGAHIPDEDDGSPSGLFSMPPLARTWHRERAPEASMQLVGAGIGLFGLRSVPLVDREPERDSLWEALRRSRKARQVEVVALRGPSGCGKSRLAEWLCERSHEVGAAIVVKAHHGEVPGPGHGMAAMVSHFIGCQGLGRDAVRTRIEKVLKRWDLHNAGDCEVLTEWTAPASEEDTAAGVRPIRFGSATERYVVLLRLLGALCAERPVVMWLDDVHWGLDALNFVSWLLEEEPDLPVTVVMTATDEGLHGAVIESAVYEEVVAKPRVVTVDVGPIPIRHRPELVRRLLGLEPRLAKRVEHTTAGHPMFAVQLIGDWVERKLLEPGPKGFRLKTDAEVVLPGDVHQVWADRVSRVLEKHTEKEALALEIAAVLGRQVDPGEWHGVSRMAGADPSQALVESLLDLHLAECGEEGPLAGWSFVHVTLRDALHRRSVERGRLQTLHRLCANLLAERGGADLEERLGRHLVAAGDANAALEPLLKAIKAKVRSGEYAASESLIAVREEALQAAGVQLHNPLWGEGWLHRVHIETRRGNYDNGQRWLDHTEAAATRYGWRSLRVHVNKERGRLARLRSEYKNAVALLQKAEVDAEALGEAELLPDIRYELAEALSECGELINAEMYARKALMDYIRRQDTTGCAACWQTMGEVKKLQGAHGEAGQLLRNALEMYEESGARWGMASACNSLGDVTRYNGDHAGAEPWYVRAGSLFRAIGSGAAVVPEYNRALTLLELGRHHDAKPVFEACLVEFDKQGRMAAQGDAHLAMAGCAAGTSDWEAWDRHFQQYCQLMGRSGGSDEDTARLAELVGQVTRDNGDPERGRRAWQEALQQWEALKRFEEANHVRALLEQ
ncbi:MAG: protein kinase [Deltaproteobacteria bacterium]|nr:protein kinase [Deltaproteobacteria bacterium]MBW2253520.1 protein kinase [Deltaproteobacteria bacterium]